jgi:transposase-like protein
MPRQQLADHSYTAPGEEHVILEVERFYKIEDGVREGLTLAEQAEIRELKKRNRLLEQENEVLRRAAIYLGQGINQ